MKVVIMGASGVLGTHVADELERRGHDVTRASRSRRPGWVQLDVTNAESLRKAVNGADAVVHCATNAFKARKVEVEPIPRVRAAAPDARIVYPSIVGCDRIAFSYYRAKVAGERALEHAGGNHAILRLTQFHEFADRLARLPLPVVPMGMRAQTIAASEAAQAVVDVVEGDAQGLVRDVGGPEIHDMLRQVKERLMADRRRRPVLRLPMGTAGFNAGYNLCPDARVGRITWADHLAATTVKGGQG